MMEAVFRGVAGALAACALVLGVSGCGPKERPVDRATAEGILIMANSAEPSDIDPHVVTGLPEHRIIKALIEGLVTEHPTDSNQVEPGVAQSWQHDGNYTVWTFKLRDNARWSNGDPVVAGDFAFAYERILNPALAAEYADMLYVIDGAAAYNNGEITDFSKVGVEVVDDHTLRIRLKGPTPYFPLMLTHYTYFPVHPPTIRAFDAQTRRSTAWTRPENFVGNGAFVLTEWRPNQVLRVRKSPFYWDAATVKLNGIDYIPFTDAETEDRAFFAGQIHRTTSVPFNKRKVYAEKFPELFRRDPYFATSYLGLNTRNAGLDDARVRRALAMSIDMQVIIDRVTLNGVPAYGFVPPGIAGYDSEPHFEYNPEAARALMAEAGYPGGEGFPALRYIIVNRDSSKVFAEMVQEMWRRELGIEVVIANMEWKVLIDAMNNGHFDIFQLGWIGDYMDPITFLKIFITGGGNNRTGFSDPEYDRLLEQQARESDPDRRMAMLRRMETILMEAMPIIPNSWSNNIFLLSPDVKGMAPTKMIEDFPYKHVRLESAQ